MKTNQTMLLALVAIFLISGCARFRWQDRPEDIVLMTYNVENLFDTLDDPGKDDRAYLPLAKKKSKAFRDSCREIQHRFYRHECLNKDWKQPVLNEKFKRLTDVLSQVKSGLGPDILFLQEVENHRVLKQWRDGHLKDKNYREIVLFEGPDKRGIDTALLSRFPLEGKAKIHEMNIPGAKATRAVLEATLRLPSGELLTCFSVHLPSPRHPTDQRIFVLNRIRERIKALPKNRMVVLAGDFNITAEEAKTKDPFSLLRTQFLISHELGCFQCKGTHNYKGKWSFLDAMLFSQNLHPKFGTAPYKTLELSIRTIQSSSYQLIPGEDRPDYFNGGKKEYGVSDHLPIVTNLRLRQ